MRITFLAISVALAAATAGAETVSCTPGALGSLVGSPATVDQLTISGTMNAADFKFIADDMTALTSLDLSAVTITATSGVNINGTTTFAAATIPAFVFSGSRLESVAFPESPVAIGDGAFAGSALATVSLGSNITSVGHGAFADCDRLTAASIGCSAVGEGAFSGCEALASVSFSAPSVALSAEAFAACPALATIEGSDKITSIGSGCFKGDSSLASFACSPQLASIGEHAFTGTAITTLDLSSTKMTSLGQWALAGMTKLTSLNAFGVTSLAKGAVMGCDNLASATFSPNLSTVGDYALAMNPNLDLADLGATTTLGAYAMSHDTSLHELQLPASLSSVGDNAMEYASGLTKITSLAVEVPATGQNVWEGVNQPEVTLVVPNNSLDAYAAAPQWKEFNVISESMGISGLTIKSTSRIFATFNANTMILKSEGPDIKAVALFDPAGHCLANYDCDSFDFQCDTTPFSTDIFIVAITLEDGTLASLKLARR